MVKTGYISFITETGGGKDENGNIIAPTKTNSEYIECNLKTVTRELKFVVDGQYVNAKYSIYLEQYLIMGLDPEIDPQTINEIQLQDNNQNNIGIFQVHNLEYLNLTSKVKIIV